MSETKNNNKMFSLENLRSDFFYGVIVILPTLVTFWLLYATINLISGPLRNLFGDNVPSIVAFFITIALITLIGITTRNFIGKAVLKFFEGMMVKIPIVNIFYKSVKQVVTAFSLNKKSFIEAVLVEYPRKDVWALAFVTQNNITGMVDKNGKDMGAGKVSLFLPTTPNPTSGFFILVNKDEIVHLAISVEESIKVLMSAGVVTPAGFPLKQV